MKKRLLILFTLFLGVYSYAQEVESRFTSFNINQPFTAITVDAANQKVWAAADQVGIFNIDTSGDTYPNDFSSFNAAGANPDLAIIKIKDISADLSGNIWIAHQGTNFNGGQGGLERISSTGNIKHYSPDRNALGFEFFGRDGLGGARLNSVTVDKNNRVWTVNRNHNLTVESTFILTPGDISFKDANQIKFTTKGAWFNSSGSIAIKPTELPYPAFTYNPGPSETPQNRNMQAISADDESVWVGSWQYVRKDNEQLLPNRVLKYDLNGTFLEQHTYAEMNFSPGGVINGICANGSKGTWVTTSIPGKGFAVYKNNEWTYLSSNLNEPASTFFQIIPEGARFNDNAIWKDKLGRVYMGTDQGLIVYNGFGEVTDPLSYNIYTNYDFGGSQNIFDSTMLSSNISGGSSDPENPYRSWIATPNGIMKLFIPIEGMKLYNIRGDFTYTYSTLSKDTDENTKLLTVLKNELTDGFALESETPGVAADGSLATLFRFNTSDPAGHYNIGSPSYRLYVGPGPVSEIFQPEYIKQYGYFYLKNLSSYDGEPTSPDDLEYVEYIYKHPEYIDEYETGKIYKIYSFKIVDVVSNPSNPIEIYKHNIKINVPPVLLGHGVWSDVSSVQVLENYLKDNGYIGQTLKAWRSDGKAAEHPFAKFNYNDGSFIDKSTDSWVIPNYINSLKEIAASNLLSAGKVNVIVHSRGGLYTRAYIEGIDPRYAYKDNINSLITLNTPHFGAQGGNLNLDKRVVLNNETQINTFINDNIEDLANVPVSSEGLTIGNLASIASVPELDRIENWGARNLMVELDNLSQVTPPENTEFIKNLNRSSNVSQLEGVPIHVVSTTFDPCDLHPILCNDLEGINGGLTTYIPKAYKAGIYLYNLAIMVTNDLPNGIDNVLKHIYDGQESDAIVPLTSMQAGLGGTRFNSEFTGITHSNLIPGTPGVTEAPQVHEKIIELLKSNVNDETNSGQFTKNGINPSPLRYNVLPNFSGNLLRQSLSSKILINRDPQVFDNRSPGDVLNFKVYAENTDKIIVFYENENDKEQFIYETRIAGELAFENDFNFVIPEHFYGETTITANGYKQGVWGYASNTVTFNVELSSNATLQSIQFSQRDPNILNQENYSYTVIGQFSDGIDRVINDMDGLILTIEDNALISQLDTRTIKAERSGSTLLTASVNGLEDTILVTIEENPALFQTILTDFYGELATNNSSINVVWNTLREYDNQTFVLETSYNTPDNFTAVNQQPGNGTNSNPEAFNYVDASFGSNEIIFYRLKMINTSGGFTYSSIIKIDIATLSVDSNNLNAIGLKLYPNPVNTGNVTLYINSNSSDQNAKLELYNLQGKRLSSQTLNIIPGNNSFTLKLSGKLNTGIYLARITTHGFIKTLKLAVNK
ncbi:T9SS type A sorting domain-containing protein [Lacinutrix sp. Hel_I_90]|uniref:T9SS type A sorting domain-containing protein n=1 Tax=Lacinutrix sp. Hel_I_90 TaxID=1249999 RepID=UPI0005CA275D|nr:T9SS type A sorting domain-containing protein [Lacinutrix sp. Hel_I_90]